MNKKTSNPEEAFWVSEPNEETKKEIYKLYKAIYESNLEDKKTKSLKKSLI